ncbi:MULTISPECIES: transcriptional regulator SlyA [Halomonas]|jgi:MarR family transcriptional regulator for hemolysin|uniref:Transcriptional regulator SlyA n=3 Tax=Halomonas TaxID=2745 RepID=A0AAU7KDZ6_9GAMM|nr:MULTISPECIES: transcriptional regulator SlyA [Halomonas]MBR9771974.1 transcriptional regulator SlyA [Gammaproteobacteria bacterium]KJZ14110.1 transcriptional regulator [Halomonas sp. S2151]MAR70728.1 transcriptional regulator SlyA [Halomonas sp.]MBR9880513.1 transcriptional regulator SlyA [Gammaproteobacteria bacterium]MBS8269205.1 transcriptional regulator SlyA [Halomonas litopenaei]|tara:strand:+ start:243 stop:689 length:447 start_codon:yes stop_codon:yes gene_type:complete
MNENIGFQLSRAPRIWRAVLDQRLAPLGLTQTRWVTLYHLWRMPDGQPQCDLARAIGVEAPSLVRTLDQLCEQGLVERCPCDQDRRTKRVHLTKQATPLLEKIDAIVQQAREEMLKGLDEQEQERLSDMLSRIEANGQALLTPDDCQR